MASACASAEDALVFYTFGPDETKRLGARLGRCLSPDAVVALSGDLGTGKTCFARGVALGLGLPSSLHITSPSFSLVNEYEGGRIRLYHMDAYRLESLEAFFDAGLEEYFYEGGVAVLEWSDRWPQVLPAGSVKVLLVIEGLSEGGHRLRVEISNPPEAFTI